MQAELCDLACPLAESQWDGPEMRNAPLSGLFYISEEEEEKREGQTFCMLFLSSFTFQGLQVLLAGGGTLVGPCCAGGVGVSVKYSVWLLLCGLGERGRKPY